MNLLDLTVPSLPRMYCLGNCGKLLWHPDSRALGYGPECAERLGIIVPSPRFARRDGGDCEGQGDLLEPTNEHDCERPVDPSDDDPDEWICPACGKVWEKRIEATADFYESWYQPKEDDGPCPSCEHCTWNKGDDCGKQDHPHCPRCFHCQGRHESDDTEGVSA